MSEWSLGSLLSGLHNSIEARLSTIRAVAGHPVLKGDSAEGVWLDLLSNYLLLRYQAKRAVVVDSQGSFSDQIDVVIFDRQYSPFVFYQDGLAVIPAESVYAVFEAKQSITASEIEYASKKVLSVRRLYRTSLPIPHAGGLAEPKEPQHIIGGLVTLESDWKPPLGSTLTTNLAKQTGDSCLDLGCVAAHGYFYRDGNDFSVEASNMAATAFLFELIARLQAVATVPMIDVREYAKWIGTS